MSRYALLRRIPLLAKDDLAQSAAARSRSVRWACYRRGQQRRNARNRAVAALAGGALVVLPTVTS